MAAASISPAPPPAAAAAASSGTVILMPVLLSSSSSFIRACICCRMRAWSCCCFSDDMPPAAAARVLMRPLLIKKAMEAVCEADFESANLIVEELWAQGDGSLARFGQAGVAVPLSTLAVRRTERRVHVREWFAWPQLVRGCAAA